MSEKDRLPTYAFQRWGPTTVAGVLLVLLWSLVVWFTQAQNERLVNDTRRALELLDLTLAEQTQATLKNTETGLRGIVAWMNANAQVDPARDGELSNYISSIQTQEQTIEFRLLTLAQASAAKLDLAATDRVIVGNPQRDAPTGRMVLPLTLMAHKTRGPFVGAVGLVSLDNLSRLHDRLRRTPNAAVALFRMDGVVLSRVPPIPALVGTNVLSRAPELPRMLSEKDGFTISKGQATDGIKRFAAYRRLSDFPITVLVTEGYDDAFATFVERRNFVYLLCGVISALAIAVTLSLARAQRRARQRLAELAAVSDDSPLGVFRTDAMGRLTYVNPAFRNIVDTQADDESVAWFDFLDESERASAQETWQSAARAGLPYRAEHTLERRGLDVRIELAIQAVKVDGRVVGHAGTVHDITEKAQAYKALRTLAAAFEATSDFVIQTDPHGRLIYMNPAARARAGVGSSASIDHLTFADFTTPANLERHHEVVVPHVMRHGVWVGEGVAVDRQRNELPISQIIIAHFDTNGRLEHFSAIMRDISAERAAATQVRRSETTMRSVAEAIPALVAVVDKHERVLFANSTCEHWLNTSREQIVGKSLRDLWGEAEYARYATHVARALAGDPLMFDTSHGFASRIEHVKVNYVPLRDAQGGNDGFVIVAQDITEQRAKEAHLLELTRIDPLTGALNRAGFEKELDERTRAGGNGFGALLCVDLDHFKEVNDKHGHPVGDELLKIVVRRLRNTLRPTDAVARLGGDEFALVLDGFAETASVEQVAEKVLQAVSAPMRIASVNVVVGASIGIALWNKSDGEDWKRLVERADGTLYRAKKAGRGRFSVGSST